MSFFSSIWIYLKQTIGKITTLLKSPFSKEVVIFLIFLFVSIFFWVLQTLQNVTEFELSVPVTYSEVPGKFAITNKLPAKIRVTLRDKGTLMYYYYKHLKDLTLSIDPMEWYRGEGLNKIPAGTLESRFRYKLRASTQLLSINPDTLSFNFVQIASKKVTVVLKQNVTLAPQFMHLNEPVVKPATITVYSTPNILSSLDTVQTEILVVDDLKGIKSYIVKLKPINGVKYSTDKVNVLFETEEFTERSIMVPVTGINFPLDEVLLSFPSEVKIFFFVGLSSYSKISFLDFQVSIDYKKLKASKDKMQSPVISMYPSNVKNIRIYPETVDCLIEKK